MTMSEADLNKLIASGENELALEEVDLLINLSQDSETEFQMQILKAKILRLSGDYPEATNLLDRLAEDSHSNLEDFLIIKETAANLFRTGDNEQALHLINLAREHLDLFDEEVRRQYFAEISDIQGRILVHAEELERAVQVYQTGLPYITYAPEHLQKEIKSSMINGMGIVKFYQGDLRKANDFYKESLSISMEIGNEKQTGVCLNNIGYNYFILGDIDLSLKFLYDALQSFEKIRVDYFIATALFNLIRSHLYRDERSLVDVYLERLDVLSSKPVNQGNERIKSVTKLCHGLVLLKNKRLRDKFKAEKLLQEIIEENLELQFVIIAMIHLAEILLLELKASEDKEILYEIKDIILKLQDLATKMNSTKIKIQATILNAKLHVIDGRFRDAQQIFEDALRMTNEFGIKMLADQVRTEIGQLQEDVNRMKQILESNASMAERIDFIELENYLHSLQNII